MAEQGSKKISIPREHRSRHEAVNVALLDILTLGKIVKDYEVPIPKELLKNLEDNFQHLDALNGHLRHDLEQRSIANCRLVHEADVQRKRRDHHMRRWRTSMQDENVQKRSELKRQITQMVDEINQSNEEIETVSKEIQSLRVHTDEEVSNFLENSSKLAELAKQAEEIHCIKKSASEKLSNILNELLELEEQRKICRKERIAEETQNEQKAAAHKKEACELSIRLKHYDDKNQRTVRSINDAEEEEDTIKVKISQCEEDMKRLSSQKVAVSSQIREQKDIQTETSQQLHRAEEHLKELEAEDRTVTATVGHDLDNIRARISKTEEESSQIAKQIEGVNAKKAELDAEYEELKKRIQVNTTAIDEVFMSQKTTEEKLAAKKQQYSDLSAEMETVTKDLNCTEGQKWKMDSLNSAELTTFRIMIEKLWEDINDTKRRLVVTQQAAFIVKKESDVGEADFMSSMLEEQQLNATLSEKCDQLEMRNNAIKSSCENLAIKKSSLDNFYRILGETHGRRMESCSVLDSGVMNNISYFKEAVDELIQTCNNVQTSYEENSSRLNEEKDILQALSENNAGKWEVIDHLKEEVENMTGASKKTLLAQVRAVRQEKNYAYIWDSYLKYLGRFPRKDEEANQILEVERSLLNLRQQQQSITALNRNLQLSINRLEELEVAAEIDAHSKDNEHLEDLCEQLEHEFNSGLDLLLSTIKSMNKHPHEKGKASSS